MSRFKDITLKLIKPAMSVVLIYLLFKFGKVTPSQIANMFSKANPVLCIFAFIFLVLSNFICAYRWKMLASVLGFERRFSEYSKYYFMGLFFNLFLPSTIGGDFSRTYYLAQDKSRYKKALATVLADRFIGLSILFLFASCGLIFAVNNSSFPATYKLVIVILTMGIFGVVPFIPKIVNLFFKKENYITHVFNASSLSVYWQNNKLIAQSLIWSAILQTVVVVCHVLIGYSMGLFQIPIWYYFIFYPIVAVLAFVVPSINGIGVREWAYAYFLGLVGVTYVNGITYAFIWLTLNTLTSLVGGLVYMFGDFKIDSNILNSIQHERA